MSPKTLAADFRVIESRDLTTEFTDQAAVLLQRLVAAGAPLGWTTPPSRAEVADLIWEVVDEAADDAALVVAGYGDQLVGLGYWRRYLRPTLRPHADLERVVIAPESQGRGIGRALLQVLIATAREAGVEMLTLDFRGDNDAAERLYLSAGFSEYGRLPGFVAPNEVDRFDRVHHVLDLRPTAR